jgi:hypothetical protein
MPRERPRQSKRVQSAVKCLVGEDRQIKDYDNIVAPSGVARLALRQAASTTEFALGIPEIMGGGVKRVKK